MSRLAWRVNNGLHRADVNVGDKLLQFMNLLKSAQEATHGSDPVERPPPRRTVELELITAPGSEAKRRRFPAKRTAEMRAVWRTLVVWLKSPDKMLELPGLSKQQRWYAHPWRERWIELTHYSSGSEDQRVFHAARTQAVFRRHLQTEANTDPDDAADDNKGSAGEATETAERPTAIKRATARAHA